MWYVSTGNQVCYSYKISNRFLWFAIAWVMWFCFLFRVKIKWLIKSKKRKYSPSQVLNRAKCTEPTVQTIQSHWLSNSTIKIKNDIVAVRLLVLGICSNVTAVMSEKTFASQVRDTFFPFLVLWKYAHNTIWCLLGSHYFVVAQHKMLNRTRKRKICQHHSFAANSFRCHHFSFSHGS